MPEDAIDRYEIVTPLCPKCGEPMEDGSMRVLKCSDCRTEWGGI